MTSALRGRDSAHLPGAPPKLGVSSRAKLAALIAAQAR